MMVRIDEPREERAALKVDHPGRASGEGRELRQASGRENLAAADRERLDRPLAAGHRIDRAAAKDRVRAVGGYRAAAGGHGGCPG